MSKTVYLVSRGSHDDYSVEAILSSEEAAEEMIARADREKPRYVSDFRIEEFELLDEAPQRVLVHNMSETQGHWTYAKWDFEQDEDFQGRGDPYVLHKRPLIIRGSDYIEVMRMYGEELGKMTPPLPGEKARGGKLLP